MKIVLLGKDGQVGRELQRSLSPLGELLAFNRMEADLTNLQQIRNVIRKYKPSVIVNAAAYTAVDQAENNKELAQIINADAVGVLAEEASALGAWLIHYSTDYVFDGEKSGFYFADDFVNPVSVYGATKLAGEKAIVGFHSKYLIFRTSWVYARQGKNFAKTMLKLAAEREKLNVVSDQFGVPTSAAMIADVTALCLYKLHNGYANDHAGIYHLVPEGETNWHEYALHVIERARSRGARLCVLKENIIPILTKDYPTPAKRPRNSRLDTSKLKEAFGIFLPNWQHHIDHFIDELEV